MPGAQPHSVPIALRGHHLLCSLGFRGLGYSPEFVRNMAAILQELARQPDQLVHITDSADAICAAFPAEGERHCENSRVVLRDRRVLATLGMAPGTIASFAAVKQRLAAIWRPSDLNWLCADCAWLPLGYCGEGLARLAEGRNPGGGAGHQSQ